MAPMKAMKTMKASNKVMTKGALVKALAEQHELKTKVASGLVASLAALATTEVSKFSYFCRRLNLLIFLSVFFVP